MMKKTLFRSGMTMIELIFSIVIMAIVILSIPSMMSVADQASKRAVIDDDVLSRLMGWTMEKSQARWDGNYSASGSSIIHINEGNLGCDTNRSGIWYRDNNESTVQCSDQNLTPSVIGTGDGNLTKGIEQLNGGIEMITLNTMYDVNATYDVKYVSSALTSINGNRATATWRMGSSDLMAPDGNLSVATNLKRVVTRFYNEELDLDMTLTFFKSNKGN
jgi:prepilin-type N-terminal cleavage/methylation domain-containing protein